MRYIQVDNYVERQIQKHKPKRGLLWWLLLTGIGATFIGLGGFLINFLNLYTNWRNPPSEGFSTAGYLIAVMGIGSVLSLITFVLLGGHGKPSIENYMRLVLAGPNPSADFHRLQAGFEGERALIHALNVFDEQYFGYSGIPISVFDTLQSGLDIDYLLVGPSGVYVIEVKNWSGRISFDVAANQWTRPERGASGMEEKSPSQEVKRGASFIEQALNVKTNPIVVFTNPTADFPRGAADGVTVVGLDALPRWIWSQKPIWDIKKVQSVVDDLDTKIAAWKSVP